MKDEKAENAKRHELSFGQRSEAPRLVIKATESIIAECKPESPTGTKMLMEEVCKPENLKKAL